eukprot:5123569-Pleurochrysis_carterae.AAC.1
MTTPNVPGIGRLKMERRYAESGSGWERSSLAAARSWHGDRGGRRLRHRRSTAQRLKRRNIPICS